MEDKDINDLKSIIELTLHWIESEIRNAKTFRGYARVQMKQSSQNPL